MLFFLPFEHSRDYIAVVVDLFFTYGTNTGSFLTRRKTVGTAENMCHTVGAARVYGGFYPFPPFQHGAAEGAGTDRVTIRVLPRSSAAGSLPGPSAGSTAAGTPKHQQEQNDNDDDDDRCNEEGGKKS